MKISEQDKEKARKDIVSILLEEVKKIGTDIRSSNLPSKIQSAQLDVIIDTISFLINYDENITILKEYYRNKQKKEDEDISKKKLERVD